MDARIVDGRKIARVTDDGKLKVLVHGRDGDDLVPVKVSEDGYLMLATDVTVEGVTVDLGTVGLNQGAPGQNPWPVTLSGKKASVRYLSADDDSVVDAGKSASVTIVPTEGHMAHIVALRMSVSAIAGASSGTQKLQVSVGNATWMPILDISSEHDKAVSMIRNTVASGSSIPADVSQAQRNLLNVVFTANAPLTIMYYNNSNVAQAAVRSIKLVLYEEAIA